MPVKSKYPAELKERAKKIAVEGRHDVTTRTGAYRRIGEQLGINPESPRNWVKQVEIDGGQRPGTSSDEATRLAELEREVRELRRAITILRQASTCLSRRSSTAPRDDVRVHRRAPQ